jgi:hypothetical protein
LIFLQLSSPKFHFMAMVLAWLAWAVLAWPGMIPIISFFYGMANSYHSAAAPDISAACCCRSQTRAGIDHVPVPPGTNSTYLFMYLKYIFLFSGSALALLTLSAAAEIRTRAVSDPLAISEFQSPSTTDGRLMILFDLNGVLVTRIYRQKNGLRLIASVRPGIRPPAASASHFGASCLLATPCDSMWLCSKIRDADRHIA